MGYLLLGYRSVLIIPGLSGPGDTNRKAMKIESIVDLAKRHMELWIIKGEYGPGQKLKEEEIAMRLGISRPPIRRGV